MMATAYLQLCVDLLGHLLVVGLQELDGLLEGLKHLVGDRLPVLDGHQVAHAVHQAGVVALLHRLGQAGVGQLDEVLQLAQAVREDGGGGRVDGEEVASTCLSTTTL